MKNSSGSALLNAIIVAGIVAAISGVILTQTRVTEKSSRNPRIESAKTMLETQVLSLAKQPGMYSCSTYGQHDGQQPHCQLSDSAQKSIQGISRSIGGAVCPQGQSTPGGNTSSAPCGVVTHAPSSQACLNSANPTSNANCLAGQFFNPATQTFCAEISYNGTETAMQASCISTVIPNSVLSGATSSCTSAADLAGPYPSVIFKGYDSAGNPVCGPVPSCTGGNINNPGNYITSINRYSLQTQCQTLGTGFLSCPPGMVISNLNWSNVATAFGSFSTAANCVPRQVPADTHVVTSIPPVTIPSGGGGGGGSTTTTTTMPSSSTTTLPSVAGQWCYFDKSTEDTASSCTSSPECASLSASSCTMGASNIQCASNIKVTPQPGGGSIWSCTVKYYSCDSATSACPPPKPPPAPAGLCDCTSDNQRINATPDCCGGGTYNGPQYWTCHADGSGGFNKVEGPKFRFPVMCQ